MTDQLKTPEGYELDLFESIPVPISFSISDIKDPTKRKQSFSKQVDLPDTMNNNAFFQGVFRMTSTDNVVNFDATAKAPIQLYKRGVKVLDGVMKLNSVTGTNGVIKYNVTILSDNADIFQLLTQIRVNEFDWSDYTHTLTRTNIKNSWTATAGTGYYYPLIERGLGRPGNLIWRTVDFVPYAYMYEVFQKCFEYIGLTWSSTFLESSKFKNILFGFGGGDLKTVSPSVLNQRIVEIDNGDFTGTVNYSLFGSEGSNVFNQISFPNPFSDDFFTCTETQDLLGQWVDGQVTIAQTGKYSMNVTGIVDYSVNYGGMIFQKLSSPEIYVYKNGVFWQRIKTSSSWSTTATGSFNFNVGNTFNFNAQSGDLVQFRLVASQVICEYTSPEPVTVDYTTDTAFTIDMTCIDTMISDGDTVDMSVFIPAMRADEFLLSVIRQFNLYIGEIDSDNVVKIEPLNDYYLATNQFTDITQLVDFSKPISTRSTANDYAKTLKWSFKPVTDTDNESYSQKWGEPYGDYSFDQGSYYAKGEQKTELAWGTIIPYQLAPGILVPRFIKTDQGVVKPNAGPPRIMFRNGQKNGTITLRDTDTTTSETVTQYPCVHHFDNWNSPDLDLNFKLVSEVFYAAIIVTTKNCYSEYYSQFIDEMTSPAGAIWTVSVKWDEIDVRDRDWRKLLMIDGALFRLNEIKEFAADVNPTTEIELVKVLKSKKRSTIKIITKRLPPGGQYLDAAIASPPASTGLDVGIISSPPKDKGKFTVTLRG